MRLSQLFFASLRDDPSEAEMPSHRLLLRAGYLRQLGSGIYSLLPLGKRVSDRVEQVIREEINAIGGQELEMPVVHPAEIWKESGRYFKIGPELVRFKDRGERDLVLAMTHEEVVALLLRDLVQSYRQLPMIVYHFQTKFRDEPRSRGGLIRVREFVMKDSYSCDLDDAGLDESYRKHYAAYEKIFRRLGLEAIAVRSDVGIKGRGMEAGYGSPLGARDAVIVVDDLVERSPNLVAGANRVGWHVRNVNVPRDYQPDMILDIANAREGDPCPNCGSPVKLRKGIEVGNIFKLGTDFTNAFGSMYLGEDGERHPIVMGSYGIGLGRNVACIVEAHPDEKGIAWPDEVAPYPAHLVSIGAGRDEKVRETAERLHDLAKAAGREILYDDRDESPGVKFTDAELLGMPWTLTVSPRSLAAGGVEVTRRESGERRTASIDEVEGFLRTGRFAGAAAA